jgi:glycolate oxidase
MAFCRPETAGLGAISTGDVAALKGHLLGDVVVTEAARLDKYRRDHAHDPRAGIPLAVVRAECTEHVQSALRWATRHGVPVVPRGAGTGLSGGSSAVDGCLVVSLERMREITVDSATRTVVTQPGTLNSEVKAAAAAHGLWYPPDPSSFEICSIGGNVATNAGGLCCVKYGVTSDYVLGLQVVLADGTAVRLGGPRLKDAAGLSLAKLFVGSEGTLGIVTEATLRLLPPQPPRSTLMATFDTSADATGAIMAITTTARPSLLEYMDRVAVNAVEDMRHIGLDRGAEAVVLAAADSHGGELDAMIAACQDNKASEVLFTADEAVAESLIIARRLAIPAVEKLGRLLLEDVGVPVPQLPALVDGIAAIAGQRGITIALIAHAGDGNTHPLIRPSRPGYDGQRRVGVRRDHGLGHRSRRHHHRRARRRQAEAAMARQPAWPRGDGAVRPDQERPGSAWDSQSRCCLRATCMTVRLHVTSSKEREGSRD